jgi:hypothetical protein
MLRDNQLFRASIPVGICRVESGKSAILLGGPPTVELHIFVFSGHRSRGHRVLGAVLQIRVSCREEVELPGATVYSYTNRT